MLKSDLIEALSSYRDNVKIYITNDEFYLCEPKITVRDPFVKMGLTDKPYLLIEPDLSLIVTGELK